MISISSVLMAVGFYSVMLGVMCRIRKRGDFMQAGGGNLLLLAANFAVLRIILPLEIPNISNILCSWLLMGTTVRILRMCPVIIIPIAVAWGRGMVKALREDIAALRDSRERCRNYVAEEDEFVQHIAKECSIRCPVVVSRNVEDAYVAGFFRHTIYLPAMDGLPKERIKHVLQHENGHILGRDALLKLFFCVAGAVMWWNPLLKGSRRTIEEVLEVNCDARVTKDMTQEERISYGETLLIMARLAKKRKREHAMAMAMAMDELPMVGEDEEFLKRRIKILAYGKPKPSRRTFIASVCVMLVLFLASYLVILQPAVMPSKEVFQNDETFDYCDEPIGLEKSDEVSSTFLIKETEGRYKLIINYEFSRYLSDDEIASEKYQNLFVFEESKNE